MKGREKINKELIKNRSLPFREVFTHAYWKLRVEYAEMFCNKFYILTPNGLYEPHARITKRELDKFEECKFEDAKVLSLLRKILERQKNDLGLAGHEIIFLGGVNTPANKKRAQVLLEVFYKINFPLEGSRGMGESMNKLKKAIENCQELPQRIRIMKDGPLKVYF